MLPVPFIGAGYVLNRATLGWSSGTALHTFRACYLADVLAGALILCVMNVLLTWAHGRDGRFRPIRRPLTAGAFLLGCGLFWEYVTPLYRPGSVSDPWDLLAYLAGGLLCLWWGSRTAAE